MTYLETIDLKPYLEFKIVIESHNSTRSLYFVKELGLIEPAYSIYFTNHVKYIYLPSSMQKPSLLVKKR